MSDAVWETLICASCHHTCLTCGDDANDSNDCTSCIDGYFLESGSCIPCSPICKTCANPDDAPYEANCTSCWDDATLNEDVGTDGDYNTCICNDGKVRAKETNEPMC